jgi:HK97 family phage prohead protease
MTTPLDIIEVKASLGINEAGEITGNAWVFSEADRVGDVITKGAFGSIPESLPILFQHDPTDVVGTWLEVTASNDALTVKGMLHLDRPRSRTIRSMVQSGLIGGLSIGFRTIEAKQSGRNRVISNLDLVEVSLVRNPSHPRARIASAKSFDTASFDAVAVAINAHTAAQTIRNFGK